MSSAVHVVVVTAGGDVREVWAEDGMGAPLTREAAEALAARSNEDAANDRTHRAVAFQVV